jgi:hypothetical protein
LSGGRRMDECLLCVVFLDFGRRGRGRGVLTRINK